MKIYIVTTGSYSDYGIDKVFTDKGLADKYFEELKKTNDECQLDEWNSDEEIKVEAKEAFTAVIDYITGELKEGEYGYYTFNESEREPNRFHLVDKNLRSSHVYDIDSDYLIRYCDQDWNMSFNRIHSYVSQEHANKLAVEQYQNVLRMLSQLGFKLEKGSYKGAYRVKKI